MLSENKTAEFVVKKMIQNESLEPPNPPLLVLILKLIIEKQFYHGKPSLVIGEYFCMLQEDDEHQAYNAVLGSSWQTD